MSKKPKRLCPFKKSIVRIRAYGSKAEKITMQERFDVCAGERCIAYEKGPFEDKPHCKRLDGGRT